MQLRAKSRALTGVYFYSNNAVAYTLNIDGLALQGGRFRASVLKRALRCRLLVLEASFLISEQYEWDDATCLHEKGR